MFPRDKNSRSLFHFQQHSQACRSGGEQPPPNLHSDPMNNIRLKTCSSFPHLVSIEAEIRFLKLHHMCFFFVFFSPTVEWELKMVGVLRQLVLYGPFSHNLIWTQVDFLLTCSVSGEQPDSNYEKVKIGSLYFRCRSLQQNLWNYFNCKQFGEIKRRLMDL